MTPARFAQADLLSVPSNPGWFHTQTKVKRRSPARDMTKPVPSRDLQLSVAVIEESIAHE